MKKIVSLILLCTLIFASVSIVTASAADFVIEDGVLTSYSGSASAVTIPADVYYIADSAFEGNKKITSVNLNNVSVIGNKAFYECTSLTQVSGGDSVTTCGAYAFEKTPFLDNNSSETVVIGSVIIKSSVDGAYNVPGNITAIAPYSFADNYTVTSVSIPSNVAEIGEGAFYNCTSLSDVSISSGVGYVGAFAFEGTSWLKNNNASFVVVGSGILIDVNVNTANITIPDTVRHIASAVFYNNSIVKKVSFPDTLSGIGKRAFYNCSKLESLTFPSKLVMIDDEAFYGCITLQSAVIPSNVKILGESVFMGCSSLKTAVISADTDVSKGLFAGCTSLESVIIGCDAETIGDYAFYNCFKLSEISVPDSVKNFDFTTFGGKKDFTVYCNEDSFIARQCNTTGIKNYQIGDSNMDGNVNIRDASYIQKATAEIVTLNFSETLRGDADFNGDINIKDATKIQKLIAGIK